MGERSERLKKLDKREYANHDEVLQDLDAKSRRQQVEEEDKKAAEATALAKKNQDFFMVFKKTGSPVLRDLIDVSPIGARLFILLAESADRTNAIVASGKALAAALDVSEPSISRAIKMLIERKLVERLKSSGSNVFLLNPEVVWSAWATGKDYCMFGNAKVLLSKNEQDKHTQKRLNVMLEKTLRQAARIDEDGVMTFPDDKAALEAAGQQRLDV